MNWLDAIKFDNDGLIPAIAQDRLTGRILMVAWMNAESLQMTVQNKTAVYYSRSRQKLWHKGETSGHTQQVHSIQLDCDADVLILSVTQTGLACHTGRESCFYRQLDMSTDTPSWQTVEPILKDPSEIYSTSSEKSLQNQSSKNQSLQSIKTTSNQQLLVNTNNIAINTNDKRNTEAMATEGVLSALDRILTERKQADANSSYVANLYHKGLNKILEKVGEEATESIISAKDYQTAQQLTTNKEKLAELQHDLIYEVADVWFHTMVTLAWFDIDSTAVLTELARRLGMSGIEEKAQRTKA